MAKVGIDPIATEQQQPELYTADLGNGTTQYFNVHHIILMLHMYGWYRRYVSMETRHKLEPPDEPGRQHRCRPNIIPLAAHRFKLANVNNGSLFKAATRQRSDCMR